MNLHGRMETHLALIGAYKSRAAFRYDRGVFEGMATACAHAGGPSRPLYRYPQTLSWMQDLPRMEAHIFDGGHFLLENHAEPALSSLMIGFIKRTQEMHPNRCLHSSCAWEFCTDD